MRMSSSQAPADSEPRDFLGACVALLQSVGVGLLGLAIAWTAFPAFAQTAKEDSVAKRARPDYDPLGIESRDLLARMGIATNPVTGSFLIFPVFNVGLEYDDNIFRIETDERSDKILRLKPSIKVQSDWDNHSLAFRAGASIGRYQDNGSEDFEDYNFGVSGRLDLSERTSVGGGDWLCAKPHEPSLTG